MKSAILAIGSANAERLIRLRELALGGKHVVAPSVLTAGGSAINHACRLLGAGYPVLPIIPLGKDEVGGLVVRTVLDAAASGDTAQPARETLKSWLDAVVQPNATTAYSTILVEQNGRRSTFSETGSSSREFPTICRKMLSQLDQSAISAVVIGHIHSDAEPSDQVPYGSSGATTSEVVARLAGRVPIVANLGRSQYRLGPERWFPELKSADILQLSYDESREFASMASESSLNLRQIVEWYQSYNLTTVITFDRFGALGILRGERRIALALPMELGSRMVDGTGAGDAMAAALAAVMTKHGPARHWSLETFCEALRTGRTWASYACTTLGGAADSPTSRQLDNFLKQANDIRKVEVMSLSQADPFLWLLHRAFVDH